MYLVMPLWEGNRSMPTPISIGGNKYWSLQVWLVLYCGQIIHGCCVFFALSGYDTIFIQCTMLMKYRFRMMSNMLSLLRDTKQSDSRKHKEILVDVYKMHLDVLE